MLQGTFKQHGVLWTCMAYAWKVVIDKEGNQMELRSEVEALKQMRLGQRKTGAAPFKPSCHGRLRSSA